MALALAGCASDAPSGPPASVAEARGAFDLSKFPLPPGANSPYQQNVAGLSYQAPGKIADLFEFQRKHLVDAGWKELEGSMVNDQVGSGTFTRAGYVLSVTVYAASEGGLFTVGIANHGNVKLAALPLPPGATPLFVSPVVASYRTDAPVEETARACHELLEKQGWQPYGTAGDVKFYRQRAIRLSARVLSAPAQNNKTVIDYSTSLMSAELPAPDDAEDLRYSDTPTQITFDSPKSHDEIAAWFTAKLAEAEWEPTTDHPISVDFKKFQIFRNPPMDLLTLELTEVEGKSRVLLRFQSAAEVEEIERRIKEEQQKKTPAS